MLPAISRFPLLLACASIAALPAVAQSEARLVADLNKSKRDFGSRIDELATLPGGVIFYRDSLDYGPELWISRGTARATTLLKDIVPGAEGSHPEGLLRSGDRVFFVATTVQDGPQVWVTDGTEAGTVQVTQHETGNGIGITRLIGTGGGGVFFEAFSGGVDFYETWFTDGTPAGTRLLNPLDESGTQRVNFFGPIGGETEGDRFYFIANYDELWRSDGTLEGTLPLADISVRDLIFGGGLIVAGNRIFVIGEALGSGDEAILWSCNLDGGAASELLPQDVWPGLDLASFSACGDRLIVELVDAQLRRTLWVSDGTAAGTHELPMPDGYQPQYGKEWNGHFYFGARNETNTALFRTDGTTEGTLMVRDMGPSEFGDIGFQPDGDGALFFQYQPAWAFYEQWRTDGTAKGTRRIDTGVTPYGSSMGAQAVTLDGVLYYAKGIYGEERSLWRTGGAKGRVRLSAREGTTDDAYATNQMEGTPYAAANGKFLSFIKVPDGRGKGYELWTISPKGKAKAIWKTPSSLSSSGTTLDFHGTLGANAVFRLRGDSAREVWTTNGTAKGTRRLSQHDDEGAQGYPQQFVTVGNKIFYSVTSTSAEYENELWVTDGTVAGTMKIAAAHNAAPVYNEMVNLNGTLYFLSAQVGGRRELWKSDGTVAGTVMVKDAWHPSSYSSPEGLRTIGDRLSITLNLPLSEELWTSDGTAAGTHAVQTVYDPETQLAAIGMSYDLDGKELIIGRGVPQHEVYQWWVSDGTQAGTQRLQSGLTTEPVARFEQRAAVAGGKLYYPGPGGSSGSLWVTDGTAAGTKKLKDIDLNAFSSPSPLFTEFNGWVYFIGYDPEHGLEVWKTDGTEAGTVLAADVEPGPMGSYPEDLKVVDGKLYFHALRRAIGRELYVIEGE